MAETSQASDIHPDVLDLAQRIVDETNELVATVETLDANLWLSHADKIDVLNKQLQALLIPTPAKKPTTTTKAS